METLDYITAYRKIIPPNLNRWVLFRHGTVVVFPEDTPSTTGVGLQGEATAFLKEHGPVYAGSSAGDFTSVPLKDGLGWLVTYAEDGMFNFIPAAECPESTQEILIGLIGRAHRAEDATELKVVHVESPDGLGAN